MNLVPLEDGEHALELSVEEVEEAVREYAWSRLRVHPLRPGNARVHSVRPIMASLLDPEDLRGFEVTLRVSH